MSEAPLGVRNCSEAIFESPDQLKDQMELNYLEYKGYGEREYSVAQDVF